MKVHIVNYRINKDEWMNEWKDGWRRINVKALIVNYRIKGWIDEQMNRWIDGREDERMND